MTTIQWVVRLVGVAMVGSTASAQIDPASLPKEEPIPKPHQKRISWPYGEWPMYEIGTVTEVTKDSITITPTKGMAAIRFPAHIALAAGGMMADADGMSSYRLKDVVVGDLVCLGAVKEDDGKTYCIGVRIEKRPGGRLPPCPK